MTGFGGIFVTFSASSSFISILHISSPNSMFDHLLESSHRDDSNKWSNIEFGEEMMQVVLIEVNFTHLIWN